MTPDSAAIQRILDANANRASEALRVVEDYFRFALNDRTLAARAKQLRHSLTEQLAHLPSGPPFAVRDATHDVGRYVSTAQEFQRSSPDSVLQANFKRVQQAIRSLEEWSKLIQPDVSPALEQLRYDAYELESHGARRTDEGARIGNARLYVLIDGATSEEDFRGRVGQLLTGGADLIQLRDKRLDDRQILQRAGILRRLTADTACCYIVNDRPDLARATDADGVHLGQEDLPIALAREILGPRALVGVSTHSLPQALQAEAEGASYVGVGPTFASTTKTFDQFPGLNLLEQVAGAVRIPSFAIGGIDAGNLHRVQGTGIRRIAVSSAVWQAADVEAACRQLRNALAEVPLDPSWRGEQD